ncbi:TRM-domain-containing protein [Ramicandelaber brevisporus]|nr:TRM-domain-containing protein [Ramicandelaber brevisporus]
MTDSASAAEQQQQQPQQQQPQQQPKGERITLDGTEYVTITEGKATILFPTTNEVFYNNVQEFNRDMSIASIKTWRDTYFDEQLQKRQKKAANAAARNGGNMPTLPATTAAAAAEQPMSFNILEALAATGLRSIRYAKEIDQLGQIVANDLEPQAVASIERNRSHNGVSAELLRANLGDANVTMHTARVDPSTKFHVIDLDPYGSAAPFIDAAVQAVEDGGLLCVTCTDLAILAGGSYPETCFARYGGIPTKSDFCHEMALRLVLHMIRGSAARFGRHIEPLMSCSIDFYLRIFVRIHSSPQGAKTGAMNTSMVYSCNGCNSYALQPLARVHKTSGHNVFYALESGPPVDKRCAHCGFTCQVGGPIWSGPLHNPAFVQRLLGHLDAKETADSKMYGTLPRMRGMVRVISEELLDVPFIYKLQTLSSTVRCSTPTITAIFSAILNAGYRVSTSHTKPGSIKTDAPPEFIWDMMRAWVKEHPVTAENIKAGSPAAKILSISNASGKQAEISFKDHADANPESRRIKLVRYQLNPTENWGPKARHTNVNKRKQKQQDQSEGSDAATATSAAAAGGEDAYDGDDVTNAESPNEKMQKVDA